MALALLGIRDLVRVDCFVRWPSALNWVALRVSGGDSSREVPPVWAPNAPSNTQAHQGLDRPFSRQQPDVILEPRPNSFGHGLQPGLFLFLMMMTLAAIMVSLCHYKPNLEISNLFDSATS